MTPLPLHRDASPEDLAAWLDQLPPPWRAQLDRRLLDTLTTTPEVSLMILGRLLGFGPIEHRDRLAHALVRAQVNAGRLTYVRGRGPRPNRYSVIVQPAAQDRSPAK